MIVFCFLQAAEEPRPGQPGYNPMRAAMAAGGGEHGGLHSGEGVLQGQEHGQDGGLMLAGHHGVRSAAMRLPLGTDPWSKHLFSRPHSYTCQFHQTSGRPERIEGMFQ